MLTRKGDREKKEYHHVPEFEILHQGFLVDLVRGGKYKEAAAKAAHRLGAIQQGDVAGIHSGALAKLHDGTPRGQL